MQSISLNFKEIRINILSGLTVALAMVPEAIAFALIAQVSPLTGLYAAFMVSLITSIFGGRPGMISGATGGFWLSDDSGAGAKRKLLVKSSEQYFLQRLHQLQLKWVEDCA